MTKPIAYRISKWDSCTEIIYKCSKCNTSFAALGYNEKYCHNCGEKQD
jgi:rRNA maturation endonuclease Nob1